MARSARADARWWFVCLHIPAGRARGTRRWIGCTRPLLGGGTVTVRGVAASAAVLARPESRRDIPDSLRLSRGEPYGPNH
jgi:hypothetical protein